MHQSDRPILVFAGASTAGRSKRMLSRAEPKAHNYVMPLYENDGLYDLQDDPDEMRYIRR